MVGEDDDTCTELLRIDKLQHGLTALLSEETLAASSFQNWKLQTPGSSKTPSSVTYSVAITFLIKMLSSFLLKNAAPGRGPAPPRLYYGTLLTSCIVGAGLAPAPALATTR
jgi:hypothetical protein